MSERTMLRLLEARIDELSGRVRLLEEQLGELVERNRSPSVAEPVREFMTTTEAADFLRVSTSLLERWRCDLPGGPPWVKIRSRVVYRASDLQSLIEARQQRSKV